MTDRDPANQLRLLDRALLTRQRERWAPGAVRHEFLLDRVADDILDRLSMIRRPLEVAGVLGAYHGLMGRRLRRHPGTGIVIEAESSAKLVAMCDGPKVVADEELLPWKDGALDLIVSVLSLQLVNDLPGVLAQVRRVLKPDGLFIGALLGAGTLKELREAFLAAEAEIEGGAAPRVIPFIDVRDAGALLQRAGFALPVTDSDSVQVTYRTPFDLIAEIRAMGAANPLTARRRVPLRRTTLQRAAEIYAERFGTEDGRVTATFEIVTMTGWAPHESQQKPLPPGSAQLRLADALGKSKPAKEG